MADPGARVLTIADVGRRSAAAQARQLQYDQDSTDAHGQPDGSWRSDCSGLICAIADLPQGIGCPSTAELTDRYVIGPVRRSEAVPYRTLTMTTAADGTGHPFGHVALIVAVDQAGDRLQIQEHGQGVGPDIRWLPPGLAYDSVAEYGSYRPFKLYQLANVASAVTEPPTGDDDMTDLTPEQLTAMVAAFWSSEQGKKVFSRLDDINGKLSTLLDPRRVFKSS